MLFTCGRELAFFFRRFVALYTFRALSESYAAKGDNRQKVYNFIDVAFRIRNSLLSIL